MRLRLLGLLVVVASVAVLAWTNVPPRVVDSRTTPTSTAVATFTPIPFEVEPPPTLEHGSLPRFVRPFPEQTTPQLAGFRLQRLLTGDDVRKSTFRAYNLANDEMWGLLGIDKIRLAFAANPIDNRIAVTWSTSTPGPVYVINVGVLDLTSGDVTTLVSTFNGCSRMTAIRDGYRPEPCTPDVLEWSDTEHIHFSIQESWIDYEIDLRSGHVTHLSVDPGAYWGDTELTMRRLDTPLSSTADRPPVDVFAKRGVYDPGATLPRSYYRIDAIDTVTGRTRIILDHAEDAAISMSGRFAATTVLDNNDRHLILADLVSGTVSEIYKTKEFLSRSLSFSPDDRYLTFLDSGPSGSRLLVFDTRTGLQAQVLRAPLPEQAVSWRADGTELLAYSSMCGENQPLSRVLLPSGVAKEGNNTVDSVDSSA